MRRNLRSAATQLVLLATFASGVVVPDARAGDVTFADGTKAPMEDWGDTFSAYDPREPLRTDQVPVALDYRKVKGSWGLLALQLDPLNGKMYWIESNPGIGQIVRANLDGTGREILIEHLVMPKFMTLDLVDRKIYWWDRDHSGRRLWIMRANLDGTKSETWINGALGKFLVLRVPDSKNLLYFNGQRELIETNTDASRERRILDFRLSGPAAVSAVIEPVSKKVYWTNDGRIGRANFDGSGFETILTDRDLMYGTHQITGIAIDPTQQKIYYCSWWGVRRANLDGTQIEQLVTGNSTFLTADFEHRMLYWFSGRRDPESEKQAGAEGGLGRGNPYRTISRLKIPPVRQPYEMKSPPDIQAIEPSQQAIGEAVVLRGKHFSKATEVVFLDGETGKTVPAQFKVDSDAQLTAVVPRLSDDCKRAGIAVQTPSGVSVTVPKRLTVVTGESVQRRFRSVAYGPIVHLDRLSAEEQEDGFLLAYGDKTTVNGIERSIVFLKSGVKAYGTPRGNNTWFMKNGTYGGNNPGTVYHEPFVAPYIVPYDYAPNPKNIHYVPVRAIRYCMIPALLGIQSQQQSSTPGK